MDKRDFTTSIGVDQSPKQVFDAITNVRGWWSEEITGDSAKVNDVFDYHYMDMHRCKIKIEEIIPNKKIAWLVMDNYFSFTKDDTEWKNTRAIFEISEKNGKTQLNFTHEGLVPEYECYDACVGGWTQYIQQSLYSLITTGKGKPNTSKKFYTIHEVALRFNELAKNEKWFEIQEELFANDVKSIDPQDSPYMGYAEGKVAVRKKGEDFVKKIEALHEAHTSGPIIAGNHFAVSRKMDITVQGYGRIKIDEIMLYEVRNGQIISEQFFY